MTDPKHPLGKDGQSCCLCETDGHQGLEQVPQDSQDMQLRKPTSGLLPLIGTCLDTTHPTLHGRCLVFWIDATGLHHQEWLPCLQDIKPKQYDRVLLQQPANWFEPVICGILDGLKGPVDHEPVPGPSLRLDRNKALHIQDSEDNPILQIEQGEAGPTLRLLNDDVNIEIKGRLRLAARDIQLAARRGEINLQAKDDVRVQGEMIHLN